MGVEKGKVTPAQREATLDQLTIGTDLEALVGSDIVIEAVVEDLAVKTALWRDLHQLAPPSTIFASNTSSLTIATWPLLADAPIA